jgi:hypothetical protein
MNSRRPSRLRRAARLHQAHDATAVAEASLAGSLTANRANSPATAAESGDRPAAPHAAKPQPVEREGIRVEERRVTSAGYSTCAGVMHRISLPKEPWR